MALVRSWVIRGLLLAALAAAAGVASVAHHRVSPDHVRAAVLAKLQAEFPGAHVHVGAAGYRLFGGVTVHDLRVSRADDPRPLFAAPVAVIAPDKERLAGGQVRLRKVDLDRPTVRLVRRPDGTWALPGLAAKAASDDPLPTVVATNATLLLTDQRPGGLPPLAVQASRLTLVNDPAHTLRFDGQLVAGPADTDQLAEGGLRIPLTVSGRLNRHTRTGSVRVEVPDLPLTPELAPAASKLDPQLAELLSTASARVAVKADLQVTGDPARPVKADVRLEVRDGKIEHPALPWPAEQVSATVRVADGRVTVEKGTAHLGKAVATFSAESRTPPDRRPAVGGPRVYAPVRLFPAAVPAADDPPADPEDRLERYEVEVRGLTLDDDLFARLPPRAGKVRRQFQPTGGADLRAKLTRSAGGWTREVVVVPRGLGVVYEKFKYPVTDVAGEVRRVADQTGTDEFRVEVSGTAGGRRIRCAGRVGARGPDPLIDLHLAGSDVPIDAALFAALPPRFAAIMTDLGATARGDFNTHIRQPQDVNRCDNTIKVKVYGGAVRYAPFPYPLAGVKGEIDIQVQAVEAGRPGAAAGPPPDADRVALRKFEAVHGGGTVWLSGDAEPVPGTRDRKLTLRVQADKLPLDADLRAAVAHAKAERAWAAVNPRGTVTFGADLTVVDRDAKPAPAAAVVPAGLPGSAGFDPLRDLSLVVRFRGPTVALGGVAYDLHDLGGVAQFKDGEVRLKGLTAGHGPTRFGVADGTLAVRPSGHLFADLRDLTVNPVPLDAEVRAALPAKLRAGLDALNPHGPLELRVTQLVADLPAAGATAVPPPGAVARGQAPEPAEPTVYWNGEVRLNGAGVDAGPGAAGAVGVVASVGRLRGDRVQGVVGNAWLDRVTVGGQPVAGVKARFQVRPPAPGAAPAVEFRDLRAGLFGGFVGGTGRLTLEDQPRYRLDLTAGDIRLEEVARAVPLGADPRGVFQGTLELENQPDPLTGTLRPTGVGKFDVLDARLYNMPVLMPLLKLLKLQAPDGTAFDRAHATVILTGDKLTVPSLDLIGSALSVGGSGEADVAAGDARFEFYTVWSQSLRRWLTTPFGDVSAALSNNLFRVDLVRRDGKTTYTPHMLPAVTDPVRAVAQRLRDRWAAPPPATARATAAR